MITAVNCPTYAAGKLRRPGSLKKKLGLQRDSKPRDFRDTGAMLYQPSYEATHWERGQLIGRASHRYRGGHGFVSC